MVGEIDSVKSGFGFLAIIGVIGESMSHDEQTLLIDGELHMVILLTSGIRWIFHDARVRIGEVVLVPIAWSWYGWCWRSPARTTACLALFLSTLLSFRLILLLLGCCALPGRRVWR